MKNQYKWDKYFYDVCNIISTNSKCLSRKIGSILVRDKNIITTGYNGPPQGLPHCDIRHQIDDKLYREYKRIDKYFDRNVKVDKCPRQILGYKSGKGLEWCVAAHSERNSLITAAKNGISTKGAKLYMNCNIPCTPCLIEIINAGIEEIIVKDISFYDLSGEYILKNSKLNYRKFSHL